MRRAIANQGEIRIDEIDAIGDHETKAFDERNSKGWIISHSESGHHHILAGDCEVLERVDAPQGARILYAIVKQPAKIFQDAASPHAPVDLADPGIYEFRIKREFDPFLEEARRVAD